ncbi:phosphatidylinositol phosphatase PTPRQ-like [Ptychodera flava]|uniref:phosphatidylinositol phosphatase PTPRQ-like n=1 Tax=Ptychodera flava TaxID=63121 RepID=UPI00396A08D7
MALPITQESREKGVCQLEGYTHYSIQLSAGLTGLDKYWSDWSDIVIVRTLEQAPISHLEISYENVDNTYESSKRDVTVFWKPLGVRDMKGEVLGYTITMSKEGENIKILVNASANATSHELQGLEKYVSYNIQVVTFNSAGSSPPSSLTILDLAQAPSEPLRVSAVAIDKNSVLVRWEPPEILRGVITEYKIYWRSNSSERNLGGSTQELQYEVKGLEEYVLYEFYVQAYTAVGGGGLSQAVIQYTEEGTPSAPLEVFVTSQSSTDVGLEWKAPSEPNGIIRKYIVNYKSNNDAGSNSTDQTRIVLKDLRGYTNYAIKVQACTSAVTSPCSDFSSEIYAKTVIGVPGKPNPPSVKLQSSRELVVSLNGPSTPNGPVEHLRYIIFYKSSNDHGDYIEYEIQRIIDQHTGTVFPNFKGLRLL